MPRRAKPRPRPYHHGDLRRAVLAAALTEIEESGPAAMSLRSIARRADVSHAAPAHHFGDKAGVLTAIAAEGYRLLASMTREAMESGGDFRTVGLAYVQFAFRYRAHFEVMFRPELYRDDDEEFVAARGLAGNVLLESVSSVVGDDEKDLWAGVVGAWSFVHGFETLWLNGNFYPEVGGDPIEVADGAWQTLVEMVRNTEPGSL